MHNAVGAGLVPALKRSARDWPLRLPVAGREPV